MENCPTKQKLPPQVEKFACAFFSLYNYNKEENCLSFDVDPLQIDATGWDLQVIWLIK